MKGSVERLREAITKAELHKKVKELGNEISRDYKNDELVLVCNLKGAFIFLADLCRSIKTALSIDFIAATSYDGTNSTGDVRIIKDLKMDVRGKRVILVEDIVDTGYTLEYIIKYMYLHNPKDVRVCALLDKRCKREIEVPIHYRGFEVGDIFLVGYGLDYNEKYRELDYLAELVLERTEGE